MMKLFQKQIFALMVIAPLLFAACSTKPEEKAPKIAVEDFFKNKNCVKAELTSNLKRKESHEYYLRKGYHQTSMHFVKYFE